MFSNKISSKINETHPEIEECVSYSIPFALDIGNIRFKKKMILNKLFYFLSFQFWNYENLKIDIYMTNSKKASFSRKYYTYYYQQKSFYENKQAEVRDELANDETHYINGLDYILKLTILKTRNVYQGKPSISQSIQKNGSFDELYKRFDRLPKCGNAN